MSSLSSFAVEAFEDHLAYISVEVVINGGVYKALPASAEIAPELDLGGVNDRSDGGFIFKKSDFSTLPKVGTKLLVDGSELRVRAITTSVGDPLFQVEYSGATER